MTVIFKDGFDSGDFSKFSKTMISQTLFEVTSISPKSGSYHARSLNQAMAAWERGQAVAQLTEPVKALHARAYVQFVSGLPLNPSANPSDPTRIIVIGIYGAGDGIVTIRLQYSAAGDRLVLMMISDADGYTHAYTEFVPEPGRYYCVEIMAEVDSVNGQAHVWVDKKLIGSIIGINNTRRGDITNARFGTLYTNVDHPIEVYIDSCAVGDSYIGPEEAPPGPCFIATAAFGSPLALELNVLRDFRNRCLPTLLVHGYYRVGAYLAQFIKQRKAVKRYVREVLNLFVKLYKRD